MIGDEDNIIFLLNECNTIICKKKSSCLSSYTKPFVIRTIVYRFTDDQRRQESMNHKLGTPKLYTKKGTKTKIRTGYISFLKITSSIP